MKPASLESRRTHAHGIDLDGIWSRITMEAKTAGTRHPFTNTLMHEWFLSRRDLIDAYAEAMDREIWNDSFLNSREFHSCFRSGYVPAGLDRRVLLADIVAIYERDPACKSIHETLINYKGFYALCAFRFANWLWKNGQEDLARIVQRRISDRFSIDIHPAAQVGEGIFIDHGIGIVIGETAIVGDDVSILHGVTLGGTGRSEGKRHPTIKSGVLLGANCTILGDITIGEHAKVGAGSVVVKDVPARATAAGVPARIISVSDGNLPSHAMNQTFGN